MGSNPTEVKFSLTRGDSQISFKGVMPKLDLVYRQYCLLPAPKHTLKKIIIIYLISSLNVHQYQHAKLETHSCYIYHCLKPQLAKEHFTIVWFLSGTLYIVPQYIKLSQSLAHVKTLIRKRLLMNNFYFF